MSLFLGDGARTVFLQDADPCAVKPEKLAAVIRRVRERFPTVERVTTYGRASTLARRAPEDLALLADAGLTRVHLGLESGADEVLMAIDKGCTGGDLIAAGEKVLRRRPRALLLPDAGAGRARGRRRARRGLRPRDPRGGAAAPAGNPLVVRLRTAAVVPSTPLGARAAAGEFVLPDDVEVAQELRDLLEQLGDARFELRSDHMLNLLQELEGSLPRDRERLMALLDEYLGWPRDEQARFADRRAARPLPAPRRLRRPARAAAPSTGSSTATSSRAPTSCCRPRRRSAPATSDRGAAPRRCRRAALRPEVPRQVPLHRRSDRRDELVDRAPRPAARCGRCSA